MGYLKLARIFGPIVLVALLGAWIWRLDDRRAHWHKTAVDLVAVVGEVGGDPKLKVEKAPAAVRAIGADRDRYLAQRNANKVALVDQTRKVVDLGAETRRMRDLSAQQQQLVRTITAQRDQWIQRAESAATRTERLAAEEEARQCDEAMNALREAGF